MDEGTWDWEGLPADLFGEILPRLPASSRRRFRLVCRSWCDEVDQRTTTDLRSRAKTLLVAKGVAYVMDDGWRLKQVWASGNDGIAMVGTSNGLLCLCDDTKPGGAIALANPKTGERLSIPRLLTRADIHTGSSVPRWHKAYGFAYHQATGRYKVVHVPCSFDRLWELSTLLVFALGEEAPVWRDVATPPDVGCDFDAGVVSVNGATYWVVKGTQDVMSFDHEDERVRRVKPLPVVPVTARSRKLVCGHIHLAEVHGRVGVDVIHRSEMSEKMEVWVLEAARGVQTWSRWYSLQIDECGEGDRWFWYYHRFTLPHFAHGEHILTRRGSALHRYEPIGTRRSRHGALHIGDRKEGTVVVVGDISQAFAHIETKEPLGVYRRW